MKNTKQCPICGYDFKDCQCRFSTGSHREIQREVVLHHLYMLSKKQLRHIIKLEKSWQISYPDAERTDMLASLSHKGIVLRRTKIEISHEDTDEGIEILPRSDEDFSSASITIPDEEVSTHLLHISEGIKVKLDEGAIMPTRAHEADAGYDLYSRDDITISPIKSSNSACFNTGVHIQIPSGYVGFLKSKSGLNVKHGITGEGVIDSGFTGSIVVKLYNNGKDVVKIHKGDKISQIVLLPIITPELVQVDSLEDTDRGDKGFGSSGR